MLPQIALWGLRGAMRADLWSKKLKFKTFFPIPDHFSHGKILLSEIKSSHDRVALEKAIFNVDCLTSDSKMYSF